MFCKTLVWRHSHHDWIEKLVTKGTVFMHYEVEWLHDERLLWVEWNQWANLLNVSPGCSTSSTPVGSFSFLGWDKDSVIVKHCYTNVVQAACYFPPPDLQLDLLSPASAAAAAAFPLVALSVTLTALFVIVGTFLPSYCLMPQRKNVSTYRIQGNTITILAAWRPSFEARWHGRARMNGWIHLDGRGHRDRTKVKGEWAFLTEWF